MVELAPGVWRIPTFGSSAINSFAIADDDGTVTLVDAGLKGATKRLLRSLASIRIEAHDVSRILLTHAHPDHAGGASGMRDRTGAPVSLHCEDAPFLRAGRRPPLDQTRPLARVLALAGSSQRSCLVDETFADGALVPVAGGIRVIHTPGHSPGHCSFLHERSGVLITGDALFNLRSRISYSFSAFCSNYTMSRTTADRLGGEQYCVAAFTHGPEIRENARDAVRAFLRLRSE